MTWLALLLASAVTATQGPDPRVAWVPNPRTTSGSWVSDVGGHLQPATVITLNTLIDSLERTTGTEIAVVVVDSLAGLEPFDFALALHRGWGVGKQGRDNGVVFLWAPNDRAMFISVGTGLEGVIPDSRAGRIRDEIVLPAFRDGRFDEGVTLGVMAIAAAARGEPDAGIGRIGAAPEDDGVGFLDILGWAGAGAGGLGAVGGGVVGVKRWRRRRPRLCPDGHGKMLLLDEQHDDDWLQEGEKAEERVGSIDWDVWRCSECGRVERIPYKKFLSGYDTCGKCGRLTSQSSTKTISGATTTRGGTVRVTVFCKNCGFKSESEHSTPRLSSSSSSSSRSSSSSSSSSGSRSGSSFGGGSSRGGGAGGRY